MPFVTAGTAKVAYTVDGNGPPLVLVHGTAFDAAGTWAHLVDGFTDIRTVVRPDYSGAGATVDDGGALTEDGLAAQVAAVITETADEPVDLVGFSLGAVVAATVAATRPELVRRLVLTAGWARPDDPYLHTVMSTWRGLAAHPDGFGRFGTLTAFSPPFLSSIGQEQLDAIAASNRPTAGALCHIDLNLRVDIRSRLPMITARTLVIGCGQDATVPAAHARELHEAIAGSGYVEIDSGHVVLFEQPDRFTAAVREFIERS
ncbi:MAG: alpha/beta fold hydrolase [Pseudonocardia sp.]